MQRLAPLIVGLRPGLAFARMAFGKTQKSYKSRSARAKGLRPLLAPLEKRLRASLRSSDSLSNILEIKMPIIPKQKRGQGNQQLRQRGMHVNKVLCLDIPACEFAEVDFVKSAGEGGS